MGRGGIIAALLIILGVGFLLRATPGLQPTGLGQDAAYHFRRTQALAEGTYGDPDPLRLHPKGRVASDTDPPGLYLAAFMFLGSEPEGSIRVFQASVGALIALVGFLLGTRLWGTPWAGLLAAAFLAVVPGHVVRTFASGYRYDGLGTLLLGFQLYAVLSFLKTERSRWLLLTTLLTFLSLATWRATVGFAGLEILVLAGVWVGLGGSRTPGLAFAILFGLGLGAILPFMRAQGVLWSQGFFLTALLGVFPFFLCRVWNPVQSKLRRATIVGTTLMTGVIGRQLIPPTSFDHEEGAVFQVWLSKLGLGDGNAFLENLYGFVRELGSPGFSVFWNSNVFSVGLLLTLLGLALFLISKRQGEMRKSPPWVFFLTLAIIWVALTALADRNKIFASIFLATLAGSWVPLCQGYRGKVVRALITLGTTASLALMGWSSYTGAEEFKGQFDPVLAQVCDWLQTEVREGEGVASDWGTGYALQTYARVPTLTDGFLESTENRERIEEYSKALTSSNPTKLQGFCREHKVRYLVLNRANQGLPFVYAGVVPREAIEGTVVKIPPEALKAALPQLFQVRITLPGFQLAYEKGPYRVIRVTW